MEVKTDEVHLGDLPSEVINYILKWVVSKELDLRFGNNCKPQVFPELLHYPKCVVLTFSYLIFRSLERVAAVCRGLYLAARDQDIWRLACIKVFNFTFKCKIITSVTFTRCGERTIYIQSLCAGDRPFSQGKE